MADSVADSTAVAVRFSASGVALAAGLHAFGDVTDAAAELLYQDRPALLRRDARALGLRVVSRDAELDELVARSGTEAERELRAALQWASEHHVPARVATAHALAAGADAALTGAVKRRRLAPEEAAEAAVRVREKIRQSVGHRNEALAIREYEKRTGSQVRLANDRVYVLTYPPPEFLGVSERPAAGDGADAAGSALPPSLARLTAADYARLDAAATRSTLEVRQRRRRRSAGSRGSDAEDEDDKDEDKTGGLFSVCGMVDGVADALVIAEDGSDEWTLTPVVVEVKNRLRALPNRPPLHDVVQMAVYMKMLGVADGDLVQCLHGGDGPGADAPPTVAISRVSMSAPPLNGDIPPVAGVDRGVDRDGDAREQSLWTRVVLPRLYALATAIDTLRRDDLQRRAFLNGTRAERLGILRRGCDHL